MTRRKNLIYIFADQWRYHAYGAAGEDDIRTPAFDAFAQDSVFCTSALSTYPLCSPHRASLLTGKDPLSLGFYTNCKNGIADRVMLYPQEITISDVLHGEGYQTAYIGKWHLDSAEVNFYADPSSGASAWDAFTPPGERRHHFDYWYSYGAMNDHLHPHYWKDDEKMINVECWSAQHETDVFISYMEEARKNDRPILCFLSWNPPHPPYDLIDKERLALYSDQGDFRPNVPEEWRTDPSYLKARQEYFAAVAGLDQQFARIISYLKATGLYDESVIVLSADHGDCMGSHGLYGKNVWYEESIRIPLVIHDPDLAPGRCSSMIMSEDQMPTLLELLGAEIPQTVTGLSQAAALRGGEDQRPYAYLMSAPGMPEQQAPYRALGLDPRAYGWRSIRTEKEKYVVDNGTVPGVKRRRLLYDLVNDPYELSPEELSPSDPVSKHYDDLVRSSMRKPADFFFMED